MPGRCATTSTVPLRSGGIGERPKIHVSGASEPRLEEGLRLESAATFKKLAVPVAVAGAKTSRGTTTAIL